MIILLDSVSVSINISHTSWQCTLKQVLNERLFTSFTKLYDVLCYESRLFWISLLTKWKFGVSFSTHLSHLYNNLIVQNTRIFYVRVPFRINTFEVHSVKMTRVLSKKKKINRKTFPTLGGWCCFTSALQSFVVELQSASFPIAHTLLYWP